MGLEAVKENLGPRIVERCEEGEALDMVPMKVGQKDHQMQPFRGCILGQLLAQVGDAGTTVQNDGVPLRGLNLHAGCVTAVL